MGLLSGSLSFKGIFSKLQCCAADSGLFPKNLAELWSFEVPEKALKKNKKPRRDAPQLRRDFSVMTLWGRPNYYYEKRLFLNLVEVGQEFVHGGIFGGEKAVIFFAFGAEENDGGEAFNLILFGVRLVLLSDRLVAAWEIEFDKDEVFGGFFSEALLGKDLFAHHLAGRAPVRAGEFYEDVLVFFFSFTKGGVQICAPVFIGGNGEG